MFEKKNTEHVRITTCYIFSEYVHCDTRLSVIEINVLQCCLSGFGIAVPVSWGTEVAYQSKTHYFALERYTADVCILIVKIMLLGQVWYLIVSIPGLCTLTYFDMKPLYSNAARIAFR